MKKSASLKRTTEPTKRRSAESAASKRSEDTIARYNELVGKAELTGVYLVESTAKFHPERMPPTDALVLHVGPPLFRGSCDESSAVMSCGVRLSLQLVTETDAKAPVIEIFAEYNLTYVLPDDFKCDDNVARIFAGRNAVFNVWGFFRELAHSSVARMGMPAAVLPLFRMPPLPQAGPH